MDWTATLRRVACCAVNPENEDGVDLLPLLLDERNPTARLLFWRRKSGPVRRVQNPGRAVRSGKWKLLEMADGKRCLFDLCLDIGEKENLIDTHTAVAKQLSNALDAWEASVTQENEPQ